MTSNINVFLENIGYEIKNIRKEKKLSANFVCENIGITNAYYSYIENTKKHKVSINMYLNISKFFEVPMSSLIKYAEINEKKHNLSYETHAENFSYDNKTLTINICNEFFNIRKSKGYTQRYVAQLMGVTAKYYNDIELGNYLSTSLYRYKEVALALNTPLYEIVEKAEYATINELKSKNTKHDS